MFRKLSPRRWMLTVGMVMMSPARRGYFDTFAEALEAAGQIEWGFEEDDAREPALPFIVDPAPETKQELAKWFDALGILTEAEAESRGSLTFSLGEIGQSTRPSGKWDRVPMELKFRPPDERPAA